MLNVTPRSLYPCEITPAPIEWEAGWSPEPVWTFRKRENCLVPAGIRTQGRLPCSLVTIQTTLYRLQIEVLYSVIFFITCLGFEGTLLPYILVFLQLRPAEINKLGIFQQTSRNFMDTLQVWHIYGFLDTSAHVRR